MSDKGGQHVVAPGVGPIARLKQENRDLKLKIVKIRLAYRDLQDAAERIEGPADWFHKDIQPAVADLHDAIRKVRGMG